MSENVKVMVRCRPFNSKEPHNSIITVDSDAHQISICRPKAAYEPPRMFTFDHIFGMESTQTEIY